MSRKITVVLEVQDQAAAKEFWDAHVGYRNIHGCRVVALAEGDKIAECDAWDEGDSDLLIEEDDVEII
jgi:hypothetical protein